MPPDPADSAAAEAPIAVTGATGFIGLRLCLHLRRQGFPVRALTRSPSRATPLQAAGIETVTGDLATPAALARLVEGARAVIHCAGAVRGRTRKDFDGANVTGLARLLEALTAEPIPRLLALSSLAARAPHLSHYAASKQAGERLLLEHGGKISWTLLRPPAVYGPGDRELLPLFRIMRRGLGPVPGQLSDRVALLYVDDLTAAITAWLRAPSAPRGIFSLCDPREQGYTWTDILSTAATVFGRPVRPLRIPAMALRGVAALNWAGATVIGYTPMLTPGKVRELRHTDWVCGWRELGGAIDWQPRVALAEGLALTLGGDVAPPCRPGGEA